MNYLIAIGIWVSAINAAVVARAFARPWHRERVARRQDVAIARELAAMTTQTEEVAA